MQTLHGYSYDETKWETKGGNGDCVSATKSGKDYFIKRLRHLKYPESSNFADDIRKQKIQECEKWLRTRKAIVAALPGSGTGNIIKPIEYFREGSRFYEIANKVDVTNVPYDQIWKYSKIDKARMMMTIAMSLSEVHNAGIVHGDLDPGNILISRSPGGRLITKLIDFTDAFFESNPPDSIMSKDGYWSPEVALYSKASEQSPNPYKKYISRKADVFSLGLIFHQYCTEKGQFPHLDSDYPWQDVASGKTLIPDQRIEPEFRNLISSMLQFEPSSRPDMGEIQKILRSIVDGKQLETPIKAVEVVAPEKKVSAPEKMGDNIEERPTNQGVVPGRGKTSSGSIVTAAKINDRNPRKVELVFSDGKKQIMDLALALKLNYVINN